MPISNADTALLGLLSEGPMHAWQIEKEVRERDMRFWTDLSQSTIYKQLRALEREGLIAVREEIVDGRLRRVYSLAEPGWPALRDQICGLLGEPEHLKWRVDLATYNLTLLPPGQARRCLARYREQLLEQITGYGELEAFLVASGCPLHRLAVARRPARLLRAELEWLDDFAAELGLRGDASGAGSQTDAAPPA